MESYKYLKDEIYYGDLYDRLTVEECRRAEQRIKDTKIEDKDLTPEERADALSWVNHLYIYTLSGERYEKRRETIQKWMARDGARDEKIEKAIPPKGVRCLSCGSIMRLESRDLFDHSGRDEVLFMFRCDSGCKRGRAFYESSQEYIPKSRLCPKCNNPVESSDDRKGDVIKTTYSCNNCGHKYSDTLDLSDKKEKPDPNYEADKNRFCFDEKRGQEYSDFKYHMDHFGKVVAEIEEKNENKEVYDAIAKIKKLPIADVQKLLTEVVQQNGYINLQFQPPEMGKDVIVPFTAVDSKAGRVEYNSKQELKKLIESSLNGTNWKLMTDGINYRVGFVSGRLRCLEREEDLKKLVFHP